MCLMIMERIRFNTWAAFYRAIERVRVNYSTKPIHGQIYIPEHHAFNTWEKFDKAVERTLTYPHDPKCNVNAGCHKDTCVYGEIFVEITDPWNVGRD